MSEDNQAENETVALAAAEMLNKGEYDSSNPPDLTQVAEPVKEEKETSETPTEEVYKPDMALDEKQEEETVYDPDKPIEEQVKEEESKEAKEKSILSDVFSEESLNSLTNEYHELGGLSVNTVNNLVKQGIPQNLINVYLQGLAAQQQLQENMAFDIAGGKDKYDELMQWGSKNLSEEDINAFNGAAQGTEEQFKLALNGLMTMHEKQAGPTSEHTIYGNASSVDVYASKAQQMADQADPRYAKDEAFRQIVSEKARRSALFSTN